MIGGDFLPQLDDFFKDVLHNPPRENSDLKLLVDLSIPNLEQLYDRLDIPLDIDTGDYKHAILYKLFDKKFLIFEFQTEDKKTFTKIFTFNIN